MHRKVMLAFIASWVLVCVKTGVVQAISLDPAYEAATLPRKVSWCDGRPGDDRTYCWRNCTSYVAYKLAATGVNPAHYRLLGHARSWATNARSRGISTGIAPRVGAVAYWESGGQGYGHVAWVDAVNPDGTVRVSSYNGFTETYFVQSQARPEGYIYFSNLSVVRAVYRGERLRAGQELLSGHFLRSSNGRYNAQLRQDGALVVSTGGKVLWRTALGGGDHLRMQVDGNLVLYDGERPLWNSRTWTRGTASAVVQNDGNFVVYTASGQPVWQSGTSQK